MLNRKESKEQERVLNQLEAALQKPISTPLIWTEETTQMVRIGFWKTQEFKKVTMTKEASLDYKRLLKQTIVARLYQSLIGTPAEQEARSIISRYSTRPAPEPSPQT
ncbi:hypothetical protein HYU45_03345 [Candidatus Daviesbacteria bacterium]|nr:hypothetical protein [Candidatus Daviesbacteria bacterium]